MIWDSFNDFHWELVAKLLMWCVVLSFKSETLVKIFEITNSDQLNAITYWENEKIKNFI